MTTCNVFDIRNRTFHREDKHYVDTNVWIYVYGPGIWDWKADVYSIALRDMRLAKCDIFLDVLATSEFINRFARLRMAELFPNQQQPKFKEFRKTEAFKPIAQEIAHAVRRIARQCSLCESGFSATDVHTLMSEFELGDVDFNDQIVTELCQREGLTLVTHDGDFKGADMTILTANPRLLHLEPAAQPTPLVTIPTSIPVPTGVISKTSKT